MSKATKKEPKKVFQLLTTMQSNAYKEQVKVSCVLYRKKGKHCMRELAASWRRFSKLTRIQVTWQSIAKIRREFRKYIALTSSLKMNIITTRKRKEIDTSI